MKTRILIALAIGALGSAVLLAVEQQTDYAYLWLEWPGVSAAYLFWGAIGGSAVMGIFLSWAVNALIYAAITFVVLCVVETLGRLWRVRQQPH